MTISSSYAFNPSADDIVRQAFQYSGLLALGRRPRPEQLADARDLLTTMLKDMQANGTVLTTTERKTLQLVPGTASYLLDADTIDVDFPTTITAPGSTAEIWVEKMVYSDYQTISDKQAQGQPVRCYVEKTATCTAIFWNVPNQAYTWNYRRIRLIRDMDNGGVTLDLTRKYIRAVVFKLAHAIALTSSVPLTRVQYLEQQAAAIEDKVEGDDNERGDMQILLPEYYGRC
jgi:hypothetical protein